MEIWKDIKDYENYQVSNLGRVKSLKGHEKILKPLKKKDGYFKIFLYKNGKGKEFFIHRLVAQAFVFNPLNKPFINHIDCDPSNNNASNLEWCTAKENSQYAAKLGRMKSAENGKKRSIPIIVINLKTGEKTYFNSLHEAAKQLHLSAGNINDVLKGKYKQMKGFTFKYKNEEQENALF